MSTVKFQTGDSVEKHFHESMFEIFFLIKEELLVIEDDKITKVSPGDTFVVSPKQNHSFEILQNSELIYFNIESDS
ncbi:MAG: cupin domain-containing protein [Ignavibacteriaceae bacterium]